MTTWVLVATIWASHGHGGGLSIHTEQFQSQAACLATKVAMRRQIEAVGDAVSWYAYEIDCVRAPAGKEGE